MPEAISAIMTGHGEGRLAVASLRSMWNAIDHARDNGIEVEPVFVLDRADDLTTEIFRQFSRPGTQIIETDFGDQGKARNEAVQRAQGEEIAFLDADDLWMRPWLTVAHRFLTDLGSQDIIVHPEFNFFFEGQSTIFRHIDQLSEGFSPDLLRFTNYWDALSLCHRSCYERFPFYAREIAKGWAYEDWHWNAVTVTSGIVHRVVPDTVLFKRRQRMSQTIRASGNQSRHRRTPLASYSHPIYTAETVET